MHPSHGSKRLSRLDAITTHWSRVNDPAYFVLRYDLAIRKYLGALLKNPDAVQEVIHEVLIGILKRGLLQIQENAGRFRDYLRASLRHAVYQYWRSRDNTPTGGDDQLDSVATADLTPEQESDRLWLTEWRACLLDRAWQALRAVEDTKNSPYYTVLHLAVTHPNDTSLMLASRAEVILKRPMRPDTFRQQLKRARRKFAELLRDEVARTLDDPSPEAIVDEFIDLGMLEFMREFIHPKLQYKLDQAGE